MLVPLLLMLSTQTVHTNFASETTTQVGFETYLVLFRDFKKLMSIEFLMTLVH